MSEYTNEQLLHFIASAMKARDMEAVAILLRTLAVQSPHDAQRVMDAVEFVRAMVPGPSLPPPLFRDPVDSPARPPRWMRIGRRA